MAGETGRDTLDLSAALLPAEADKCDLFAAIRWIEAKHPDAPRVGEGVKIAEDPVRFRSAPSMAFAPSAISALHPGAAGAAPVLYQQVLGLFGPNAPMPLHLTEYVCARAQNHRDHALARFGDIFHHRLVQLFYRAWADAEPTARSSRAGEGTFEFFIDCLIGMGARSFGTLAAETRRASRHQSVHMLGSRRTVEGLEKRLRSALACEASVRPFRLTRDPLDPVDQSQLGRHAPSARLGMGAVLGRSVRNLQSSVEVSLRGLSLAAYQSFLRRGPQRTTLVDTLRLHLGDCIGWKVTLHLGEREVPPMVLGRQGLLGQTTWIGKIHGEQGSYAFTDWNERLARH